MEEQKAIADEKREAPPENAGETLSQAMVEVVCVDKLLDIHKSVRVPAGTILLDALSQIDFMCGPCAGTGKCGRCVVEIDEGILVQACYYQVKKNIGCKLLISGGGDTGSRIWMMHRLRPGARYLNEHQIFFNKATWPAEHDPQELPYQPDWYGWPTHQIHRLKDLNLATQDQINLIVGGNAARIYNLPTPKPMNEMFAHGRTDLYVR
jgi:ferredoxin